MFMSFLSHFKKISLFWNFKYETHSKNVTGITNFLFFFVFKWHFLVTLSDQVNKKKLSGTIRRKSNAVREHVGEVPAACPVRRIELTARKKDRTQTAEAHL